jgi:hypothetical protein
MTEPIDEPIDYRRRSVNAAVCEGDFCEIPEHHEQAIVNRRLDDDRI